MGKPKSSPQVVARKWYWGQHLSLCHGPIDAIRRIWCGEKVAWSGNANSNARIHISQPNLFGPEDKTGGVVGHVDVMLGAQNQGVNDYLASRCGQVINGQRVVSAYRHIASLVWRKVYMGNSPYPAPVSVEAERFLTGWDGQTIWYAGKAKLANGINPAHIIHELIECPEWGVGNSDIDDAGFKRAADTLYSEGFGLNFFWNQQREVNDVIKDLCRYINGYVFTDEASGKVTIKLARDDYNSTTLPVLDGRHISKVRNVRRRSNADIINTLTLNYTNPSNYDKASVTAINSALVNATRRTVGESTNMPLITDGQLAYKIAMRELKVLSAQMLTCEVYGDTTLAQYQPGDVIRVVFENAGINHIMRVQKKRRGSMVNPEVRLELMQDVFVAAAGNYAPPPPSDWTSPISEPQPVLTQDLFELPYYLLATGLDVGELANLPDYVGYLAWLGKKPTGDSFNAQLYVNNSNAWRFVESSGFTTASILVGSLNKQTTQVEIQTPELLNGKLPKLALIGNELVVLTSLTANSVNLIRAVLDTEPQEHTSGTPLLMLDGSAINEQFVEGETVKARAITVTARGELPVNQAVEVSETVKARAFKPLNACNVKFNGLYWPAELTLPINVTWSHRNRLNQTTSEDTLQSWYSNGVAEPGTITKVDVYNADTNELLHTANQTNTNFEITETIAPATVTNIEIRLTTERDNKDCLNLFKWVFKTKYPN